MEGTEYYLYYTDEFGAEDLLWYTEENEVSEDQARSRFYRHSKKLPSHVGMRLYAIDRPENLKRLLMEKKAIVRN